MKCNESEAGGEVKGMKEGETREPVKYRSRKGDAPLSRFTRKTEVKPRGVKTGWGRKEAGRRRLSASVEVAESRNGGNTTRQPRATPPLNGMEFVNVLTNGRRGKFK